MKGLIKKSMLVIALAMAIGMSYANEVSHNNNDRNLTRLTFENVKVGEVVQIKDMNGLVLYKEAVEKAGLYSKDFDLTTLPDGDYLFELNKIVEIFEIPFKVSNSEVLFKKELKKSIFKPMVYVKNGKMHITKLALKDEAMEVIIYYENSERVLTDKVTDRKDATLGKVYDFAGSEKGQYIVVVKSEGRRFVNQVNI